jgi:hypothetical protein
MAHEISLEKAAHMTARFRKINSATDAPKNMPVCETFERDAIERILRHSKCKKLRIYYGMDEEDQVHAILVGVNDKNEDILPAGSTGITAMASADSVITDTEIAAGTEVVVVKETIEYGEIIEDGQRCPTQCPPESPLNT